MELSRLKKVVAEVAADKKLGATVLALKTVEIYALYFESTIVSSKSAFLRDLTRLYCMLRNAQTSMASIGNVVDVVSQYVYSNKNLPLTKLRSCMLAFLADLKISIVKAKTQIAQNALDCIPSNAVIITLSESSTVEEVIRQAHTTKRVSKVIVAESRPLYEGLNFAERLLRFGVPVTVIVDAALGFFCKDADLAIVGADAVQSDGSVVHKVGTYPLALACCDLKKPFYVACDTLKISKTATYDKPVPIEIKPPEEIISSDKLVGAEIQNIYFDVTPSKYITGIVTEKGAFSLFK